MAKKRILVVEDESALVTVVTRRLEANQYEVISASDGVEGLQKALSEKPDLIISDIMMPKMDGYTFIKQLRAEPSVAQIPVIILTAKDKMKDLFFFEGVGECDYLVKPFDADVLLARVAELLKRASDGSTTPSPPTAPPPSPTASS